MSRPFLKIPGILISILGIGAILLLAAYLQGPPRSVPGTRSVEFPIEVQGPPSSNAAAREAAPSTEASVATTRPLVVDIDLEAGEFEIRPTRLGKSIHVEADFDEALHRLEHDYRHDPSGDSFRLTFENHGPWQHLRRALHEVGDRVHSNRSRRWRHDELGDTRVRVDLPIGVPMDLTLKLGKGRARVDLSGLSLRRLSLEHAMGEARLVFDEPNPIEMEFLDLRGKMGELRVSGLGYTRTRALDFSGHMGSFELDLDGPWAADVEGSVAVTMGDAVMRVPSDLHLQMSNRGVILGGLDTPRSSRRRDAERDTASATLTLKTAVRFGNLSIR